MTTDPHIHHHLDTQGLICPEPVMMLHRAIRQAQSGDVIEVLATDPATTRDIPNFCRHLGHELIVNESITDYPDNANNPDAPDTPRYRYLVKKKPA